MTGARNADVEERIRQARQAEAEATQAKRMTPARLAEIRREVADYQCQECALDVELLAYVDKLTDQLAALRAEVEALRDEAERMCKRNNQQWDTLFAPGARTGTITQVLDLIDKHAREGQ